MSDINLLANADDENERSLNTLARAIQLSRGQFCLIVVRCNYACCQERMAQQLQQRCSNKIREFVLPKSVKTLYTAIKAELGDEQPPALMVLGLEAVQELDALLSATNQVRDEFRKDFSFPIILWVNDYVLRKLVKIAPDFISWTGVPIEFKVNAQQLQLKLKQKAQQLLTAILEADASEFLANSTILGIRYRDELAAALRDLQSCNIHLDPELDASIAFVWGRDAYASDQIDQALKYYQDSLTFWQQNGNREQCGILQYHLGLCWLRYAELERPENQRYWQDAKQEFQQAIHCFEQAGNQDLVAKFVSPLGEVLRRLKSWNELQTLAQTCLELHQTYGTPVQLAQDYGFLAEVALEASHDYKDANDLATQALAILNQLPKKKQQQRGLYELLLARSQQHLDQPKQAILTLEPARQKSNHQDNPQLYIDILNALRSLYFEQGDYLEAFRLKQERRAIESLYGFRAFIGAGRLQPKRQAQATLGIESTTVHPDEIIAPEIATSGRNLDVKRLMARIKLNNCKITVIHGISGVGKSSILTAGLVPALKHEIIQQQQALPIVIRVYTNWQKELAKKLAAALESYNSSFHNDETINTCAINTSTILEELQTNEARHLLTILIFDQFEEFFFVNHVQRDRRLFWEFLESCLKIPYVKIILALREDYLHYLLEYERLPKQGILKTDILDRNNRYYLGNFSPKDAELVIKSLTERSHLHLEPALIDQLVQDLARELGEVRPIELQIVGDQLQTQNITTLEKYRKYGKQKLVEQFLETVVEDCGNENREVAKSVLYLLTDEKGNRPLKTYAQIQNELAHFESEKLELVLEIFVASGLVMLLPEVPAARYQLVHDYLVTFIRQTGKLELRRQLTRTEEALTEAQQKIQSMIGRGRMLLAMSSLLAVTVVAGTFIWAVPTIREARKGTQIERVGMTALRQFESQEIEALLSAIQSGQQLNELVDKNRPFAQDSATSPLLALQTILDNIHEKNRLSVDKNKINDVSFNPDGQRLVIEVNIYQL